MLSSKPVISPTLPVQSAVVISTKSASDGLFACKMYGDFPWITFTVAPAVR